MTHDSDVMAAAYLFGELEVDERRRFEEHLLRCEECWTEVESARRGMQALEATREFAPAHLRDKIREAGRGASERPRRVRALRRPIGVAAAALIVTGASLGIWSTTHRASVPAAIVAAVDGYIDRRLPGAGTPDAPAPDLPGLTEVGAGAGRIESLPVNAYAFRDASGRRLMVYIGVRAFPMPDEARPLNGSDGPWISHHDGVAVLCARYPHELLIVGKDDDLVRAVAESLDVI